MSSISVEVSRSFSTIDSICDEYDKLLERADWINPYFSPAWLRCWWDRQPKDRAPLLITAQTEGGELLGFWPFVERPGLLGSKGLWPFIYDEANYHFPTCENRVAPLLVDKLSELLGEFLFVWVPQIPEVFWQEHFENRVKQSNHLQIYRSERTSMMVKPTGEITFDEYLNQKLGPKSRKSLNYDKRSLEKAGDVSWEDYDQFEEVRSVMPASCLVELQSHKNMENAGLYSIRGKRGFFFELLPELAKSEGVRISFLRVNDHPVAWQLELLCPGFSYLHHLAFDEAWKKYSPGKQLLFKSMERCWKEGRVFDFLPAPFAYKESYTNQSEPAHELHWIKKSIRGRIARKLITWNMNWRKKMRDRSPGIAATAAREEITQANAADLK